MSQDKLFLCNGMQFLPLCVLFVILWPCGVWAEASFAIGGGVKTVPFNSVASFYWKSDVTPRVYPAQPQTFRFSKQASANASVYSNKVLQANTYRSVGGGQQLLTPKRLPHRSICRYIWVQPTNGRSRKVRFPAMCRVWRLWIWR